MKGFDSLQMLTSLVFRLGVNNAKGLQLHPCPLDVAKVFDNTELSGLLCLPSGNLQANTELSDLCRTSVPAEPTY